MEGKVKSVLLLQEDYDVSGCYEWAAFAKMVGDALNEGWVPMGPMGFDTKKTAYCTSRPAAFIWLMYLGNESVRFPRQRV